jgi:tetratricopeptide (TPR) repeat protein
MMNLLKTFDVAPPNRPGRESADAAAALRTLGYVSGAAAPKATYTEADDPKRLIDIDNDLHTATELTQSGRTDEAIATLDRALASGAPDRDVRIRLGIYLAESHQDPARAIQVLEAVPDEDVEGLYALGLAYGDAGRAADAVRVFKRVLALDSTNGLAYQNIAASELREALQTADAQQKSARFGQAEANARQAIAVDPQLADAYTTLGVVLSSTARKPQAVEAWKQAVALDPGQFNALYNLWLELADAGRREEASAYGRQFVASAPPAFFAPDIARVRAYLRQQP